MEEKRLLVCAVTSDRHSYVIDRWIKNVQEQIVPKHIKCDVFVIDNSTKMGEHYYKLHKAGFQVIHVEWDVLKDHFLQMLAKQREIYRWKAVAEGYDYIMNWDTDIIIPKNGLFNLLKHDKDNVGYVAHVFYKPDERPCVLHSGGIHMDKGGLDYFTWDEIKEAKGKLIQVYATGLGILLTKRKCFEKVPFRTHPTFIYGEDLWFFNEANDKGFEFWCDTSVRVKHYNKEWSEVEKRDKSGKKMQLWFGAGPTDAKVNEYVDRSLAKKGSVKQKYSNKQSSNKH